MSADAVRACVCLYHHCHGVPADDAFDPPLEFAITGKLGLLVDVDRVDVGRARGDRQLHAMFLGIDLERMQQAAHAFGATVAKHVVERLHPVLGFQPVFGFGRIRARARVRPSVIDTHQ